MVDWSLFLNFAALGILVVGAAGVGRTRRFRDTIGDLDAAVNAKDARIDQLEQDVGELNRRAAAAERRATECEKAVAKWEARYEELKRYTAEPAVRHFETLMADHSNKVAERHALMIDQLARMERTMSESQSAQGELNLKVLEVLAKVAEKLDVSVA